MKAVIFDLDGTLVNTLTSGGRHESGAGNAMAIRRSLWRIFR